jgi:hypothetical protein
MMTAQFSMNVEHISCAEVVSSLECKSSSMAESFDLSQARELKPLVAQDWR